VLDISGIQAAIPDCPAVLPGIPSSVVVRKIRPFEVVKTSSVLPEPGELHLEEKRPADTV